MDILDKMVCDNKSMKEILNKYVGKKVYVEYNLGRNKIEKYEGIIDKLYNAVFLIKVNNEIKSFSYSDLITKTIKIYR